MSLPIHPPGASSVGADLLVRDLGTGDMAGASALLGRVWDRQSGTPMDAALLVALQHSGNYVAGAFEQGRLVAVCAGFLSGPAGGSLHSHIAGVVPEATGRGIGLALKLHQRDWCRARGIGSITWTFDPLVARNAYFNFHRLGVRTRDYLVDFYGTLDDGLNAGHASDRLLVSWPTAATPVQRPTSPGHRSVDVVLSVGPDLRPRLAAASTGAPTRAIAIPNDIEALRQDEPMIAREWRKALRKTLRSLLEDGWSVQDFERSGRYLLGRP